jgi:hypothetical protein
MSITFHVFLRRDRTPSAADWSAAIRAAGFAVQLPADFDPAAHSGYLPCPDDLTGFELYRDPFSEHAFEIGADGAKAVGERNTAFTFRFSGRDSDLAAATAAAATLAAMTDGILFDSETGHFIAADQALAWARNERYEPVAIYRHRSSRRRARLRPSTVIRLLIVIALAIAAFQLLQR